MNVGIIGIGKIGSKVAEALLKYGAKDLSILISERNSTFSKQLQTQFPKVKVFSDNQALVDESEIILVALRTEVALSVLQGLCFKSSQTLISLVPSTKVSDLKGALNVDIPIIRMTPLPPIAKRLGAILVYGDEKMVADLFSEMGHFILCKDEEELHALWAISGFISPYYEMLKSLQEGAVSHGAQRENAQKYVAHMTGALSNMALLEGESFRALSEEAKTPGGLNAWTHEQLEKEGVYVFLKEAFDQVMKRF